MAEDQELYADDLMPTDGEALADILQSDIPDEQQQAENEERAMIQGAEPLFNDLLDWFDNQIKLTDSIANLDLSIKVPLEAQVLAQKLLKNKLQQTRISLSNLRDKYSKQ